MKVIKRDGREVPFDKGKISAAVFKAMSASGDGDGGDALQITDQVEDELDGQEHSVEEIQDIVERTMMKAGFCEAAKAYCLYRDKRNHARDARSSLMKGIDEIIQSDARKNDRKRENANIDGNTPMGAMLQIGSTCARAYNELYFLRPEQAKAHREGDWHIHDFDFYAMTTTCCQIDLLRLFHGGFSTGHGYLREPQSIRSYAALAAIAIQANQNDQHGGQSIPNFDYAMAEGVAKSFQANYRQKLKEAIEDDLDGGLEEDGREMAEEAIRYAEEASSEQLGLGNTDAFDGAVIRFLRREECFFSPAGLVERARARAGQATERDTYQAMEGFVHNLNTMHSRAGAQV